MTAMRITVFGGSHPRPGEPAYQDGLHLGRLIAQAGYTLLTGGYIGTMEALSRGASEAGGQVIGVTCDQIEAWRPVKANPWVSEDWHKASFQERIFTLIENCDACLALPGGVGTLTELVLTWNLLLTNILPPRPLILIGQAWQSVIHEFILKQGEYIPKIQRQWVSFAPDVDSAFKQLQETLSNGKL
ncbi:MAG: hypothetical protein C3F13_05075 [Anaerolineales bacterium]|nr:MAG: hypothetical protein C3F13_05075 [Anaerolineales bacterium]